MRAHRDDATARARHARREVVQQACLSKSGSAREQQRTTADKSQQVAQLATALAAQQQLLSQRDQELARLRIQLAARQPKEVPSPQTGSSVQAMAKYEQEIDKLRLVVETAHDVWG